MQPLHESPSVTGRYYPAVTTTTAWPLNTIFEHSLVICHDLDRLRLHLASDFRNCCSFLVLNLWGYMHWPMTIFGLKLLLKPATLHEKNKKNKKARQHIWLKASFWWKVTWTIIRQIGCLQGTKANHYCRNGGGEILLKD